MVVVVSIIFCNVLVGGYEDKSVYWLKRKSDVKYQQMSCGVPMCSPCDLDDEFWDLDDEFDKIVYDYCPELDFLIHPNSRPQRREEFKSEVDEFDSKLVDELKIIE
ncbi:hypothetical protein Tco_1359058 [Tanacetum coccineum]